MEGAGGMRKAGRRGLRQLWAVMLVRHVSSGPGNWSVSETYEYGCEIIPVCAVTTSAADNRRRWAGGMNERQTRQ